ncbi:F0F1 ATP synthase subunit A [Pontiella agarivorans]|uniref:ATP synthase subunit a n=1 Tax=Pontiella agarivorans TaxID=3038953 RepID=A0ABU5MWW7_9BACT|nr:F0F1 ATP synthase subunit A [Pontiella agarivorans]MDZ8118633.1 F0F1 ATP synthase subunit A [Pontiella agarivorans]
MTNDIHLVEDLQHAAHETADRAHYVNQWVMHHVTDSGEWHTPLWSLHLPPWMSNNAVMLIVASLLLIISFGAFYRYQDRKAPRGWTNALEALVLFVRNEISIAYLGPKDGRKMAPLFLTFFFFILTCNLMGLCPLFSTATGNINVTFGLASVTFFFMVFGAMYVNGPIRFFKAFAPEGVPWPILIILMPIEMIGLVIKCVALTIRLFANMLAGHIVVFSLVGLLVTFGYWALPALGMALAINLLEVFIAFLQAYVFTVLSAMFIGEMYHPAH